MADKVEQVLQDMVPEFDDLRRKHIFDDDELRQIVKRRRDFEYLLQKAGSSQQDFLGYVRYEVALESLRLRRSKALNWRKRTLSDYAGVRRMHFIFERSTRKFKGDKRIWYQYIDFCLRSGSTKILSKILLKALKFHPKQVHLWVLAADRELRCGHIKAARTLLLRGLRFSPMASKLWAEFLRLEVQVARNLEVRKKMVDAGDQGAFAPKTPQADVKPIGENPWAPSQVLLRRALSRLDKDAKGCAAVLSVAVKCLEEAETDEAAGKSTAFQAWSEGVRKDVAARRPSTDPEALFGAEVLPEVTVALWELWWRHERSLGRSWHQVVKALVATGPPAAVQHAATCLAEAAATSADEAAGSEALRALINLAESPCVAADQGASLSMLAALEHLTEVQEAEEKAAIEAAYKALAQRASDLHAGNLRLRLLAWQARRRPDGGPADLVALLSGVRDISATDASQLFALSTASSLAGSSAPKLIGEQSLAALFSALGPEEDVAPVLDAFLGEALSRGCWEYRQGCEMILKVLPRLWDSSRLRIDLLAALLSAELRCSAAATNSGANPALLSAAAAPMEICRRFEDLLSALGASDARTVDWWVRYVEYATIAGNKNVRDGVPSATDLHLRAMRSIDDQALYAEKSQRLRQSLAA